MSHYQNVLKCIGTLMLWKLAMYTVWLVLCTGSLPTGQAILSPIPTASVQVVEHSPAYTMEFYHDSKLGSAPCTMV